MLIRAVLKEEEVNMLKRTREDAGLVPDQERLYKVIPDHGLREIKKDPSVSMDLLDGQMKKLYENELPQKNPAWVKFIVTSPYSDSVQKGFKPAVIDLIQHLLSCPEGESEISKLISMPTQAHESPDKAVEINQWQDPYNFIFVKSDYKMVKIQVKDILYLEGKGNYVSIYTRNSKVLVHQPMKKLETFFLPYQFLRIHKSYIVSFQNIDEIYKHSVTINDTELPISDFYKDHFQDFLIRNARQI